MYDNKHLTWMPTLSYAMHLPRLNRRCGNILRFRRKMGLLIKQPLFVDCVALFLRTKQGQVFVLLHVNFLKHTMSMCTSHYSNILVLILIFVSSHSVMRVLHICNKMF